MLSHTVNGAEIRRLREERGITAAELAQAAGITVDYLYRVERGERQPSGPRVRRIADLLEVQPRALLHTPARHAALRESA